MTCWRTSSRCSGEGSSCLASCSSSRSLSRIFGNNYRSNHVNDAQPPCRSPHDSKGDTRMVWIYRPNCVRASAMHPVKTGGDSDWVLFSAVTTSRFPCCHFFALVSRTEVSTHFSNRASGSKPGSASGTAVLRN